MKKLFKITLTLFLAAIIVLGFALPLNPAGNWYQQFFPNLSNQQISDVTFLDSLIGFAVTESTPINDTAYILKTTNGGDNWIIKHRSVDDYSRIMFANSNTGFTAGGDLIKTTNAGENWTGINRPNQTRIDGMYVLNNDTLWLVDSDGLVGGVFRTTNGGANWQVQYQGNNPNRIYMVDRNLGFISPPSMGALYRTTNSGVNWTQVPGADGFLDMKFADASTGWKARVSSMKKTTDGGLNWVQQTIPSGGIIFSSSVTKISLLNKDTLWAVGGEAFYGSGQFRGIIFRTINGGVNWLFQVPDTAIHLDTYTQIQFISKDKGWAYRHEGGIHTTNGGDTTWLVGVTQVSSEVPKEYRLYQNYPNPFNPVTIIKYQIINTGYAKLVVYDVTGKEIAVLVNKEQRTGTYQTDFTVHNISSGVYFYQLTVTTAKEVYRETKRMILIK